jgi:hypothetical protein
LYIKPQIEGEVPAEWLWKESMTYLAPTGRANVIASSEPLAPEIDSKTYATVQGDLLRNEFPGYVEHEFGTSEAFGLADGFVRRFEWTPPDGVTVMQLQLYAVQRGRGFTATATAAKEEFLPIESTLITVLMGLRVAS